MIELLLQAERALSVGLLDRAETLYRQVARADPRNSMAVVGLARVTLDRGDEHGALELARRALAIDPENDAAQRMVARLEEVIDYRVHADDAAGAGIEAKAGPEVAAAATEEAAEPEVAAAGPEEAAEPGLAAAGPEPAAMPQEAAATDVSAEPTPQGESEPTPDVAPDPEVEAPFEPETEDEPAHAVVPAPAMPAAEVAVPAGSVPVVEPTPAMAAAPDPAPVVEPEPEPVPAVEMAPVVEPDPRPEAPPKPERRRSFLDWLFRRR